MSTSGWPLNQALSSEYYSNLTLGASLLSLQDSCCVCRVAITMTVSAFWHGIHPGYFLSFLFVPINLVAEDLMAAAFRNSASPWQQSLFDWGGFFFTMRFFEYMSMGFMLLTFKDTVAYWASIGFLGHVFLVIFITLALAFKPKRSRKDKQADHAVGAQLKKESWFLGTSVYMLQVSNFGGVLHILNNPPLWVRFSVIFSCSTCTDCHQTFVGRRHFFSVHMHIYIYARHMLNWKFRIPCYFSQCHFPLPNYCWSKRGAWGGIWDRGTCNQGM